MQHKREKFKLKYALISDLHIDFLPDQTVHELVQHINVNTTDVDAILNAGDIAENLNKREEFFNQISKPTFHVMGNHDYYRSGGGRTLEYVPEHDMVLATLWTNFNNDVDCVMAARKYIMDFRLINFWSHLDMNKAYKETIEFIENHRPKIVVTHFGPHKKGIAEKYKKNEEKLNRYFINDCSSTIKKVKPAVWAFGHTHSAIDTTVGKTRIIANPMGYPNENYYLIKDYPIVKFDA